MDYLDDCGGRYDNLHGDEDENLYNIQEQQLMYEEEHYDDWKYNLIKYDI